MGVLGVADGGRYVRAGGALPVGRGAVRDMIPRCRGREKRRTWRSCVRYSRRTNSEDIDRIVRLHPYRLLAEVKRTSQPGPTTYHGHDGIRRDFRSSRTLGV